MKLLQLIEDFDFFYPMSDDPRTFDEGLRKEREIERIIQYFTPEQVIPFIKDEWRRSAVQEKFFKDWEA